MYMIGSVLLLLDFQVFPVCGMSMQYLLLQILKYSQYIHCITPELDQYLIRWFIQGAKWEITFHQWQ